ncbi:MAG TPA: HEAT repeat domain-containing protein [Candidatus Polarisedimenticolia bacterium]|jgi:HEAT repeat protein
MLRMNHAAAILMVMMTTLMASAGPRAGSDPEQAGEAQTLYDKGTDLMDDGEWSAAIKSFAKVIDMDGKLADGARYWKAYSLRKLARLPEALSTIDELRRISPDSSWLDDARALELEIRQESGHPASPEAESDEELKLVALNALLNVEPERALPLLEKFLKAGTSPRLREQALFVLMQTGSPRARDLVLKTARGQGDPSLQRKAIEYLGIFGDTETRAMLKEIFASTIDREVRRAILNAYMVSGETEALLDAARREKDPGLRGEAINLLGAQGARDELRQLYRSTASVEDREQILQAFGICGGSEDLIEAARNEKDPRLRRAAIQGLGIGGGGESGPALLAIYSEEKDTEVRMAVIDALMIQGNDRALIGIARKETNPQLKKEAIERLGTMGSKEATEFLLEILNK